MFEIFLNFLFPGVELKTLLCYNGRKYKQRGIEPR